MPHGASSATGGRRQSRVLSAERPNTLGLGPTELFTLLDFMDADEKNYPKARREYARWPFRHVGVKAIFEHPGGGTVTLRLAGRNISRGGVSLLHNGFLHPGTKCRLTLRRIDGTSKEVSARVVRCQHRRGMLHEIGIRFDRPLDPRPFLKPHPSEEFYSLERVDPSRIAGSIVYVEDNPLDAKIVAHFLRESPIKLRVCATGQQGMSTINEEECDLMLVDHQLPDMRGTEFIRQAREHGTLTPALILTARPAEAMEDNLWQIPDVGLIKKPFTQDHLLRVLAERLLLRNGEQAPEEPRETSKRTIGPQLNPFAYLIETGVKAGDVRALMEVIARLQERAESLGATQIAVAARTARNALAKKNGLTEDPRVFSALADLCRRAA